MHHVENAIKTTGSIRCNFCCKWFHRNCKNHSRSEYISMLGNYSCEKCLAAALPFFESDNIDIMCALYGEGDQLCGKCKRDCLAGMQYTCCYVCNKLHHLECISKRNLGRFDFECATWYNFDFVCSTKCYQRTFPFSEIKHDILVEHGILTETTRRATPESKMEKKKAKPTKQVPIDHFYDINCSYLHPNELNDDHIGYQLSLIHISEPTRH